MQGVSPRLATASVTSRRLRSLCGAALLLLAIQFLVGMLVNLFVVVPAVHPGTAAPDYFVGVAQGVVWALENAVVALRLHVIIGLLLFIDALALIALAIASRRRAWVVSSLLGLLGIMAAGFNGASFMNYGHDFSSLFMSIGFLTAVIAYALGFYVTHPTTRAEA